MSNIIDIILRSISENKGYDDAFRGIRKVEKRVGKLNRATQTLAANNLKLTKNNRLFDTNTNKYTSAQEGLKRITKAQEDYKNQLESLPGSYEKKLKAQNTALKAGANRLAAWGHGWRAAGQSFNMASLSILFGSMAIMNVMKRLATGTVSTFMEIADSNNMAKQGIEQLKVGFKVLSFAIGEAIASFLLPYVPAIMNIIEGMLEWIDNNGKLAAKIILVTGAIAAGLFVYAQFTLFLSGLKDILGSVLIGLSKVPGVAPAATKAIKNFSGVLRTASLLVGVAFAVDFAIDAWKVLSTDGSTIGDYGRLIGKAALAGALIGGFFGPKGALLGAAIGTAAGLVTVGFDLVFEAQNAELAQIEKAQAEAGKRRFIAQNYGGYGPAVQAAIIKAKQLSSLQDRLSGTTDLGARKELQQQIASLDAEIANIATASNETVDNIKAVAAAQRQAAQDFATSSEEMKTFDDIMKENVVSAKEFIESVKPEKITKLSEELTNFVSRMNDLDFTSVTKLTTAFTNLQNRLGGSKNEDGSSSLGLIAALGETINKIDGEQNSVISSFDVLLTKINEVGNTVETVLITQLNNATSALNNNASAAREAASAQQDYNNAVSGN